MTSFRLRWPELCSQSMLSRVLNTATVLLQLQDGVPNRMTYSSTMMKIVVPQAIKNILPTLGNEFISLIKETSVLSFIAVYDLYKALLDVGMVKYDSMVPYIMMGLIYIVLVLIISLGIKLLERRFAKSDRN